MAKLVLRDYQIEALNTIDKKIQEKNNVLLRAVTGAGKTVIACTFVNKYYFTTKKRFLILAHKQELVEQFLNTFKELSNVPLHDIGVCCASLNLRELTKRVTIATVQTFFNLSEKMPLIDLLIIDEVHRVDINNDSQYKKVIDDLQGKNKYLRILGITATPFRVGHGYIYGNKCVPEAINLFDKIDFDISYKQLVEKNFLMPVSGKIAIPNRYKEDLDDLKKQGADYVLDELGEMMTQDVYLETAIKAMKEEIPQFLKHVCLFCCTISHAEKIYKQMVEEGFSVTIVHSKMNQKDRVKNLEAWKQGAFKYCVSVNILLEGFDFPALDCLVFIRPTTSPILFIQAIGRMLRIAKAKTQAFLLDLTDNSKRFGLDIDNIKVEIPNKMKTDFKNCPSCGELLAKKLMICLKCGFIFKKEEEPETLTIPKRLIDRGYTPDMVDIENLKRSKWIISFVQYCIHESKKTGKQMIQMILYKQNDNVFDLQLDKIYLHFLFKNDGFSDYAISHNKDLFENFISKEKLDITGDIYEYPESSKIAFYFLEEFIQEKPMKIIVNELSRFPEFVEFAGFVESKKPQTKSDNLDEERLEIEKELNTIGFEDLSDEDIPF